MENWHVMNTLSTERQMCPNIKRQDDKEYQGHTHWELSQGLLE